MGLDLRERLEARRPEIEQALLTRVFALEDPSDVGDPDYVQGLRAAVDTGLSYGLSAIEGTEQGDPIPHELLAQARRAARLGVSLDTVLRRYLAAHTLIDDFIVQEAGDASALAQSALRSEAALLDRLLAAVGSEYRGELETRARSSHDRRGECVKRLLAGELADTASLGYDLATWHLGVVAAGPSGPEAIRGIAAALDRRLLLVRPGGEALWAWLGGRSRVLTEEVASLASATAGSEVSLAIGEPGSGIAGWRLTHRQAKAALPVALRAENQIVSYSDVAILASALSDEVLTSSLTELYLAPLAAERDGGAVLRQALCAYFAAGRNIVSAANALGVSRQTVSRRLDAVEQRIGRPLETCGTEVETALRLCDLQQQASGVAHA